MSEGLDRAAEIAKQIAMERTIRGLCTRCGRKVTSYERVGACVYGDPCGHRQYQGTPRQAS